MHAQDMTKSLLASSAEAGVGGAVQQLGWRWRSNGLYFRGLMGACVMIGVGVASSGLSNAREHCVSAYCCSCLCRLRCRHHHSASAATAAISTAMRALLCLSVGPSQIRPKIMTNCVPPLLCLHPCCHAAIGIIFTAQIINGLLLP
eukprot:SAG11_NODE_6289_length_1344_cov_0.749398_1_plen_145_part_10